MHPTTVNNDIAPGLKCSAPRCPADAVALLGHRGTPWRELLCGRHRDYVLTLTPAKLDARANHLLERADVKVRRTPRHYATTTKNGTVLHTQAADVLETGCDQTALYPIAQHAGDHAIKAGTARLCKTCAKGTSTPDTEPAATAPPTPTATAQAPGTAPLDPTAPYAPAHDSGTAPALAGVAAAPVSGCVFANRPA